MSAPHEPGSFLRATLESQPAELRRLLQDDSASRAAERLRGCSRLFLVGTGTSHHGAMVGQFMFRSAGLDAWAVRAFEFANYPPALRPDDGLVLLSHRGTKLFSRAALDVFAGVSDHRVAIAGEGAPADDTAVVRTVEQERSPVHTASHTGAMLRLAQLATALGAPTWRHELSLLPDALTAVLALRDHVAPAAEWITAGSAVHFAGGGPGRSTAYEGALKLREASHVVAAEGHDIEGMLHGPLISIQPRQAAVVVAQPGPSIDRTREVADALHEIDVRVLAVGAAAGQVEATFRVTTPEVDEVLAPILNVVPLQWLAYEVSRRVGVDADSFRKDEERYAAAQSKFTL